MTGPLSVRARTAVSLLIVLPVIAIADPTCNMRQGSTCICDMSDGSGVVDLTPISSNSGAAYFQNIQGDGTHFTYNPCQTYTDGRCSGDVAVCQGEKGGIICGKQSTAAFQVVSGSQPMTLTLTYTGGQPSLAHALSTATNRQAIVTLICDPAEGDISFKNENPRLTYNFVLKTKYACPQQPPPPTTSPAPPTTSPAPPTTSPAPPATTQNTNKPRPTHSPEKNKVSVGTILDITFLLVIVAYITGGIVFMRVRHQATGWDLIPNRAFWTGLPSLIKDGCIFLVDRCRSLKPTPYEKI